MTSTGTSDKAEIIMAVVETVRPILAGLGPDIQGAVIADLLAIWLAGHSPALRDDLLEWHITQVRGLIDTNEEILFEGRGHPDRTGETRQ